MGAICVETDVLEVLVSDDGGRLRSQVFIIIVHTETEFHVLDHFYFLLSRMNSNRIETERANRKLETSRELNDDNGSHRHTYPTSLYLAPRESKFVCHRSLHVIRMSTSMKGASRHHARGGFD